MKGDGTYCVSLRETSFYMKIEITMPKLNDDMETGILCQWNVEEGDTVSAGDILCEIEYNKVVTEIEAERDMTIVSLNAEEGDELLCGAVIAIAEVDA